MKFRLGLFAAGISVLAAPTIAAGPNFDAAQTTLPLHYRYAACVYAKSAGPVEEQIRSCAPLRAELTTTLEGVLDRFHRGSAPERRRKTLLGFDMQENQARQIREKGLAVPEVVLSYLDCMGSSVIASTSYAEGTAIDYVSVEPECREATGMADALRADSRLVPIYHRFDVRARTVYDGRRKWPDLSLQYGFFDARKLPEQTNF